MLNQHSRGTGGAFSPSKEKPDTMVINQDSISASFRQMLCVWPSGDRLRCSTVPDAVVPALRDSIGSCFRTRMGIVLLVLVVCVHLELLWVQDANELRCRLKRFPLTNPVSKGARKWSM